MKEERLLSMPRTAVAFDLETHLIQPGLVAPPIVLGSAAEPEDVGSKINLFGKLLSKDNARRVLQAIIEDPTKVLCGANIAYDLLCFLVDCAQQGVDLAPAVFRMYDPVGTIVQGDCDGRVFDVQIAEALHAIAQGHLGKHALSRQPLLNKKTGRPGRYSLDTVTFEVLGREDAKDNDRFRLSYAGFDGWPLEKLPYEAAKYPVDDAINTLEDALAQAGHMPSVNPHNWRPTPTGMICSQCQASMSDAAPQFCMLKRPRRNLHDLARQTYAHWALSLGAAWGFHVPQDRVDELEQKYLDAREASSQPFLDAGFMREDGTENQSALKYAVARAYGCDQTCTTCNGSGKVISEVTGKTKVNCKACDGTKLYLDASVPRSPAGGVKKDRDTLQESGDELLMAYGEQEGKKILSTYIPLLRKARACNVCGTSGVKTKYKPAHEPWCSAQNGEAGYRPIPLILRPNPLVETGRCSFEDGIHGLPRKGGVRECIRARPGYVLSSTDVQAGELVTHAWNCLKMVGYSKLADALNGGLDAHLALAGTMLGLDYVTMQAMKKAGDPRANDNRQAAKAANFGFGGGMAELTFVLRKRSDPDLFTPCPGGPDEHDGVRGYKGMRPCILMGGMDLCGYTKVTSYNDKPCAPVCKYCLQYAKQLREFWFRQWPENNPRDGYFAIIKKLLKEPTVSGGSEITHHQSKRVRGGVEFCDGANGLFQGLLSDSMKNAYCQIQRECVDRTWRVRSSEHMTSAFDGGASPLLGSRAIILAHDETVAEHPESVAAEAAERVSEITVECLRFMCPELAPAVKAEPALMDFLSKKADTVRDANGRLIPWGRA